MARAPKATPAASASAAPADAAMPGAPPVIAPLAPAPDQPVLLLYPVRSPLKHGGRRYRPDDPEAATVEMTEGEAEALIAIGVLGDATGPEDGE
ncbi:hypothetical protein V5G24_00200 [Xanthobacter sp. VTT E-85241]|uniref:hypothetical protein n=1 Tax=Roseixanthobacter finlandensis TaxID=3119922 RepID=UPI0037298312